MSQNIIKKFVRRPLSSLDRAILSIGRKPSAPPLEDPLAGILLAVKSEDKVFVTWSSCSPRDKFDRRLAETIALSRVATGTSHTLPYYMEAEYQDFLERVKVYFKVSPENIITR